MLQKAQTLQLFLHFAVSGRRLLHLPGYVTEGAAQEQ